MGPRVNLNEIGVIVKDGVVTLTGWVDSYTKRAGGGAPASFDIGRKRPGTRLSGAGEVRGPTVQRSTRRSRRSRAGGCARRFPVT